MDVGWEANGGDGVREGVEEGVEEGVGEGVVEGVGRRGGQGRKGAG